MIKEKRKIIIDTDNGDDIDDLITLYFALDQNEVEIIGIISSYLNAPLRKKQIEKTLELHNISSIPVFSGCRKPINGIHGNDIHQIYCQYQDILGPADEEDEGESAIHFLISKAKELRDRLTILEIAPETTLARAILLDKEAFKNTPIVIMGGSFYDNESEWNIECDYSASKVILESGLDLTYVGLDVTMKTTLENPEIENYFLNHYQDERLNYLSTCSNLWVNCSKRHIVLHDPLTFLTTIDKDVCKFKQERVLHVEKDGRYYTKIDSSSSHMVKVAYDVNLNKVYQYVYKLFKGAN